MKKQKLIKILNHRGYVLSLNGKYIETIKFCDKVLKIDKNNKIALLNKANALLCLKKPDRALISINRILKHNPYDLDALITKATSLRDQGKSEDGLGLIEKVLVKEPNNISALKNRAMLLNELGRSKEALDVLEIVLRQEPDHLESLINKAAALSDLKRFEEALSIYNHILEKYPDNVNALVNKGVLLSRMGNGREAIELYDKALDLDPENPLILSNKGNDLDILGDFDGAILCYDKALKHDPERDFVLLNKAAILNNTNKFQEAEEILQRLRSLYPDYPHTYTHLGILYLNLQDYELGLENFMLAKEKLGASHDYDLIKELGNYIELTNNLIKLTNIIRPLDEKFIDLIHKENWIELRNYISIFYQQFGIIINSYQETTIPSRILHLLEVKKQIIGLCKNILESINFSFEEFEKFREMFIKENLDDYIQVINILENLNLNIKKYGSLNAFLINKKPVLEKQILSISELNGTLTRSIFNKLNLKNIPINNALKVDISDNPLVDLDSIISSIDTKYSDSTHYLKQIIKTNIEGFRQLSPRNFMNFCEILSELVNYMHYESNQYLELNASADQFWDDHKENNMIEMEKKWFQPEFQKILNFRFGENVNKEVEEARGSPDFKVYNIPIELKVFNDRKNTGNREISGIDLLKNELDQSFQYLMHTKCGFLVGYDYRIQEVNNNAIPISISERIKLNFKGNNVIFCLLFHRKEKPSKKRKK